MRALIALAWLAAPVLALEAFSNATIFAPPTNTSRQVSYARSETLPDGSLIVTWTEFSGTGDGMPIYRSIDDGHTWKPYGICRPAISGRNLVQPHLLYAYQHFGKWPAGTIYLAVNAADNNSTNIEIYASKDQGRTFEFASTVASGGPANTTNGATPVWEPFLLVHEDRLVAYYSDQRDPKHGQKLAHQTTKDVAHWGSVINDVRFPKYTDRPGMTTVAQLGNGQYIITFEYALQPWDNGTYKYPIHYKIAEDPELFDDEEAVKLIVDTGANPNGGPVVTWSPYGGDDGTIIVSDSDNQPVWANWKLGKGVWTQVNTTAGRSYSREVRIPRSDLTKVRIIGGAEYGQTDPSRVTINVNDISRLSP